MVLKGSRKKMLRNRVAQGAALLLYTSQEKEYKQAKERAAETLSARILPSNREVVEELDRIAEEREGTKRKELLLRMRKEAQEIMEVLKEFSPRLVGSVWRGTARKGSDIDIMAYSQDHLQILKYLQKHSFEIVGSERLSVTRDGQKESSFHVQVLFPSGDKTEVVVRTLVSLGKPEICETYGDVKTGLSLNQLVKVLTENPFQKFVPT